MSTAWTRRHIIMAATGWALMPEITIETARAENWKVTAPSEAEPHARTWMAWPSMPVVYGGPGAYYESV